MSYILTLRRADGIEFELTYDPRRSILTDADGDKIVHPMFAPEKRMSFKLAHQVSPDRPGRKRGITTLKIQLGFSCNYACAYCNQASHSTFLGGLTEDAHQFLETLPTWFDPKPTDTVKIEFWGGEPFVYWAKLKVLVPALRERYPDAGLSLITNGSLLDDEKVDWIIRYNMSIVISHDGPGQNRRHPEDILDDPEKCRLIRRLVRHGNVGFGSVLTRWNVSLAAIRHHIEEKLELPPGSISSNTEEILLPYDDDAMMCVFQTEAEHTAALHTLFDEAIHGYMGCGTVRTKIEDWFFSLGHERVVTALGQKCGMDKENAIAVNLMGDVTTCQNTSATGKHKIGSVVDLDAVSLDTAHHHQTRDECRNCPVVQLCKGACMFLEGKYWTAACDVSFTYNLAMLSAALHFLVGAALVRISATGGTFIRRPGTTATDVIRLKGVSHAA